MEADFYTSLGRVAMYARILRVPLGMLFIACLLFAPAKVDAVEAVWIGGSSGNWSDPANWSTGVVPSVATTNVTIDDGSAQESTTTLDQNATVGNLWIDSGDALNFDASRVLIASSAKIAGNVNFAPSSRLHVGNSLWVQGSGSLSLVDASQIYVYTSPYYVLWNEGRVEGAGRFDQRVVLNNEGTVVANVPGKQLLINPYSTTDRSLHFNRGELIAETGGALNVVVESSRFTPLENSDGLIEARGDSTALLQRIRLVGGLVSTSTAGGVQEGAVTLSYTALENVTLERNVKLDSVVFSGRVINNTRLEEMAANNFYVEGNATISGDGWLELNNGGFNVPPSNIVVDNLGIPGIVNDVNHTIKGPGVINSASSTDRLVFDNRGVIETSEGTLQINLRTITQSQSVVPFSINSGTIRAKAGGRVEILGTTPIPSGEVLINSAGSTMGLVEAGVDSTVVLGNMTLRGGVLRAVAPDEGTTGAAGKVITNGTQYAYLEDMRLEGRIGDIIDNSRFGFAGTIENTGVISGGITIFKPTTLTGGGEINFGTFGGIGGYSPQLDVFYDPLINEDNFIHGAGGIGGNMIFINRAVVQADIPNGTLSIVGPPDTSIEPQPYMNSGEFKAINGGKMTITAQIVNFEGSDLGTIHAGVGSQVTIAKVSGGILSTDGTGKIIVGSDGSLANVHNLGSLVIGSSIATQFLGKTTNDGTVTQTYASGVYFGGPFAELTGNGVWGTTNVALAFEVGSSTIPSIFTHGAMHTIQGGGKINVANGAFINRGTVIANSATPLVIAIAQGATIQQQGWLAVNSTRTMEIQFNDELFVNRGIIDAMGTFQLRRMNAGPVEFRNAPGAELHIDTVFNANQNGFKVSLWNQQGALMAGHGNVNLYRSSTNHETLLRNSGVIRPEGTATEVGEISISGNFQQDSSGLLKLDLSSPASGEFDALHITEGHVLLGGTLEISLLDAYDPSIGDSFEILTNIAGLVSGTFDQFDAPALSGRWWSLDYQSDRLVLEVNPITADFNSDGVVDGFDLAAWQSANQVGSNAADADGDGDSDGRDFLAWQRQYGSGIGPVGLVAVVPEPSGIVLLFVGIIFISARRLSGKSGVVPHRVAPSFGGPGLLATFAMLVVFSTCQAAFAAEAYWTGGPAGAWSDPANWSTGVVPNLATTNVSIDDNWSQESTVVLDQNATIQNLVVDVGDVLQFDPSRVLTANSVTIGGELSLAASSQLKVSDYILIEPEATLSLADGAQILRVGNALYVPIMNQGRVEGAGGFLFYDHRFAWNNEGSVVANVPSKRLDINLLSTNARGVHLNTGELIAENGGELRVIGQGDISNQGFFTPLENSTGLIEARGDSKISMSNIRLVGGQLSTSSTGGSNEGLITFNSVMFENVTLEGNLALNSVTFSDRVVNNTHSVVSSFYVEGYVTITGNGSLDLNGGYVNIPGGLYGGQFVGTPGFVNDVNHTIKGPGKINSGAFGPNRLAFDNRGVIECEDNLPWLNPDTLQINLRSSNSTSGGSSINSGTIRARSGGMIEILGTNPNDELTNYSGVQSGLVEAALDSTVSLGAMTLRGGILRAVASEEGSTSQAGKVITSGTLSATLEDLRLEGKIGDNQSNSRWNLAGRIENTGILSGVFSIAKPTTLTGGGEIRIEQGGGIRRIDPQYSNPRPQLVNEDNLIHGAGDVGRDLAFTNRGTVQADVPGDTLRVFSNIPSPLFNSGVFRAIEGSTLEIQVPIVNYEGSNLGTIHAGDASEVRVVQVNGGILSTEGTGRIVVVFGGSITNGSYLADVHNQGTLVIDSYTELRGRIINDGTLTQNGTNKVYVGETITELTGSGVWGTQASPVAIEIGMPSGGLFVHGSEHTIQGGGTINVARGTLVNRGTVISNGSTPLKITLAAGTSMQQEGSLVVESSSDLEIQINDERFSNRGIINAEGDFQIERLNAGSIEFRNTAGAELSINSSFTVLSGNAGSSLWNQAGALIAGHGNVDLHGATTNHETLFRNSGTLWPEGSNDPTDEFNISGNFQQDVTGVLEIDLGGAPNLGEFDRLNITNGGALLGGTLDVSLVSDYDPLVGDSFEIINNLGGTITGAFDNFTVPALSGRWWSLDYLSDRVVLNVNAITADFDGNGFVDTNDLDDWQAAHQAGTNLADADGDGDSDGRDFLAWQRQFGSGIPVAGVASVPEPSTLLLVALCGVWFPRRRSTQFFR